MVSTSQSQAFLSTQMVCHISSRQQHFPNGHSAGAIKAASRFDDANKIAAKTKTLFDSSYTLLIKTIHSLVHTIISSLFLWRCHSHRPWQSQRPSLHTIATQATTCDRPPSRAATVTQNYPLHSKPLR